MMAFPLFDEPASGLHPITIAKTYSDDNVITLQLTSTSRISLPTWLSRKTLSVNSYGYLRITVAFAGKLATMSMKEKSFLWTFSTTTFLRSTD